ncbi:hypothetical protein IA759_05575 [Listeria marthii]|uniref:Uncharacterized protein n=1 Tax=Listeria swaminathanii TaxID=2713501 RepID=A0A7X1DP49_9LIST|nr:MULTISPECIES: hypothetical protein [Listeria]MBC1806414.1 hypothetical protein [Listeria cossartiae subsp. cayugensis]MBC2012533.1 hypothetical protein [Listeria marthii]MBC2330821.1 hypothetical protein [Listeria swaminathanii]MBF2349584.1 hypothetical protein [Listeria marthii]MBF2362682.1 hypothetical protein [Listeria marthii]
MIKLNVVFEKKIINGHVKYIREDGALDFTPMLNSDISLLISYINIGFDSTQMTANQVWGFAPKESWRERKLALPLNIRKGKLVLLDDYEPGTWRLDKKATWYTYYDSEQNWLCFGDLKNSSSDTCVEFLENIVAVLDNDQHLKSLWIKPNLI